MQTPFKISDARVTNKDARYTQVGQSRPCTFSFAEIEGDTVYYLTKPVLCRDYLNDTLVWDEMEDKSKTVPVCGYHFTGPVKEKDVVLYMEDAQHLLGKESLLKEYEEELGLKPVQFLPTVKGNCVVVVADPWWKTTTLHFSWFTQLLRYLSYESVKKLGDASNENMIAVLKDRYWNFPYKLAKLKVKNKRRVAPLGNGPHDDASLMHTYSGFYGFLSYPTVKHEYKEEFNSL